MISLMSAQVRCLPYTGLTSERWMGSRAQSTVGCFPELCFLQFSVVQVHVGLRKQFINIFVFPTWACAAGFNNNNNDVLDDY